MPMQTSSKVGAIAIVDALGVKNLARRRADPLLSKLLHLKTLGAEVQTALYERDKSTSRINLETRFNFLSDTVAISTVSSAGSGKVQEARCLDELSKVC